MEWILNNGKRWPLWLHYPVVEDEGGSGGTGAASYKLTLTSGFSFLITAATHELVNVNKVTILRPDRSVDDVYVEIRANGDVYVESNINLNGYILIINGEIVVASYSVVLGSVTDLLITAATHGVSGVNGVTILRPDRSVDDVYVEIRANDDVYIESNINLLNYILKIY